MRRLGEANAEPSRRWVRGNFHIPPTLSLPHQGGGELIWASKPPFILGNLETQIRSNENPLIESGPQGA